MADVEDPYGVLGVSRNAERSEIRKKFQELARKVCQIESINVNQRTPPPKKKHVVLIYFTNNN